MTRHRVTMTEEAEQALRKLANARTPGEWTAKQHSAHSGGWYVVNAEGLVIATGLQKGDAFFIAEAPAMVEALRLLDNDDIAALLDMATPGSDVHDVLTAFRDTARAILQRLEGV